MPYRTHKETDEGIILLKRAILHSDVVIVVLTRQFGKIALLGKGAQTITSKRIAALQTGNIVRVSFSQKNNEFRFLSRVELISHLSAIKKDLKKMHTLYSLLFLYERLIPEGQIDTLIYDLCKKQSIALANDTSNAFSLTDAMSAILSHMGYGTCSSFEECTALAEDIMGKKMPVGII